MEYRPLDVTVVSAEDLKKVTHFGKMQTYAVVWLDPHQRRTTRADKDGHSNPSWNERLSFFVPEHLLQQPGSSLHVEIYSKGIFGNKFVGMAIIPLSEILQQSDAKEVHMYQLRRRSGKVKGAVRLSVHMGEKTSMPENTGYLGAGSSVPVMAYPFNNQKPYHGQGQGGYQQAYPPQQSYQPYPPQGYYPPQQGYYQQPPYYQQPGRRPGMMGGMGGMGMGTGLLAGALGGLVVGEMMDDAFDGGGYDGGGFDGGGFDGGF